MAHAHPPDRAVWTPGARSLFTTAARKPSRPTFHFAARAVCVITSSTRSTNTRNAVSVSSLVVGSIVRVHARIKTT